MADLESRYPGVPRKNTICTPKIELSIQGWANIVDILIAEIEEKEKKRVEDSENSSFIVWSWRGLPKRTSNMP